MFLRSGLLRSCRNPLVLLSFKGLEEVAAARAEAAEVVDAEAGAARLAAGVQPVEEVAAAQWGVVDAEVAAEPVVLGQADVAEADRRARAVVAEVRLAAGAAAIPSRSNPMG